MLATITAYFLAASSVLPSSMFGSPVKIFVALAISAGWAWLAPKINQDAISLPVSRQAWSGAYLGAGVVGLTLWLLLPIYLLGLLAFLTLVGGTLVAYVLVRNDKVEPEDRIGTAEWFTNLARGGRAKIEPVETQLRLYDSDGRAVMLTETERQDANLVHSYNFAQMFLYDLTRLRASEADITPHGEMAQVRYVVDGVLQRQPALPQTDANQMIQYLKAKAGLDEKEVRRPQKGKISVDLADSPVDMEILTAGSNVGQRMQVRVIQEAVQSNLDLLGMDESLAKKLVKILSQGPGLLIVSGPGKSGVTSTLYSLLRRQDAYMRMLVTVEAKAAMDLENITQNEYRDPARLPEMLSSVIRRDPDVILLDQCPDAKTAEILCQFAREKFVILGAKARDSFTALARWMVTVGSESKSVPSLQGVLCQTLLRKICPTCREPYRPDPKLLGKINLPADRVGSFYRPPTQRPTDNKGNVIPCRTCQDSGYYGRTGVFEFLEMTPAMRQLIAQKASLTQIKGAARKNQMQYLKENALGKVVAGVTSIQEVVRTFQSDKDKK